MIRKGMTVREAARIWADGFFPIPTPVIEKLHAKDDTDLNEITLPAKGDAVRIFAGKYAGAEGVIAGLGNTAETYMVLRNGTRRPVKVDENDLDFARWDDLGLFPVWKTMWVFNEKADDNWLDTEEGRQAMSDCGFRIYESKDFGHVFGIEGAGCDFFETHFLPLYKARGLQWHDPAANNEKRRTIMWDILNEVDVRDALQALIDHYGSENVGYAIASYFSATPAQPIEVDDNDKEGICPLCGGDLEFEDNVQMDDGGVYPWKCPSCGATGKQGYNEVFDGHHYDVRDAGGKSVPGREEEK